MVCAALIYAAGSESRDSIVVWLPVALVGFALMLAAAVWRRDYIDRDLTTWVGCNLRR